MKLLHSFSKIVFPDTQEITEEVILHYEKNPDELDLIINKEYFNAFYLGLIFVFGFVITISARIASHLYGDSMGEFVNSVILDVISEVGIAIFGGAIVAYLIEMLNKKQYQQNIKFRRKIKAIIDQRSQQNKEGFEKS
ncbi:MAG: hypothetical protein NXI20_13765 [bacterium]|nr:hypothetical protein [bacterium]